MFRQSISLSAAIVSFMTLLPSSALSQRPCADLSGRYVIQGEDGRVYVTIEQPRCDTVMIVWLTRSIYGTSRTRRHLKLDGRSRAAQGWFRQAGSFVTAAEFRSDTLTLVEQLVL